MLTPLVLAPFLLAGCGSSSKADQVTLTSISPATTAACPNGGTTITSGVDTNHNGTLDASEVTSTQNVCNGAAGTNPAGYNTLVETTSLPAGNANCVNGGTEIQSGLDNGAGGGTANDGILQSGEVTSTQYVCNYAAPTTPSSITPPDGTGSSKIDVSGAAGVGDPADLPGGNGGSFDAEIDQGTLGGNVTVFASGVANTTMTLPTQTPNYGAVEYTVTASTTLPAYDDQATALAAVPANGFYRLSGTIYQNVAGVATTVTGLYVQTGTLTFALSANETADNVSGLEIDFANDVNIAGTIAMPTQADAVSPLSLSLGGGSVFVASTGTIDLSGLASTGVGGNAGSIGLAASGLVLQQGTLTANGGSGATNGGGAGTITLESNVGAIYNTGALTANGGPSTAGGAGVAGQISLSGAMGGVHNAGALSVNGGTGATSGSNGGSINLMTEQTQGGSVVNSGASSLVGGTCNLATGCAGSTGGSFGINALEGAVTSSGAVNVSGGTGFNMAPGGSGGSISFYVNDRGGNFLEPATAAGSIEVSGNLTAAGAAPGGYGGSVNAELDIENVPAGQQIVFYGYTTVDADGGAGTTATLGGSGGGITLEQDNPASFGGTSQPAGGVLSYAALSARGGDGSQSNVVGAGGGEVSLETQAQQNFNSPLEFVASYGNIDVSGGANAGATNAYGGRPGDIDIDGLYSVTLAGTLTCNGGAATNGQGGQAGNNNVEIDSDGAITNSATITSNGGAGATGGGGGGGIELVGGSVTNSGNLTCDGGTGTATDSGGDGGEIFILSAPNGPSKNTGTLTAAAGTGGEIGEITIDGAQQ